MEFLESGIGCLLALIIAFVFVAIWWKIIAKMGYPPLLSLLMFLPLVNLGMLLFFAFSEWPVQRRIRELEGRPGHPGPV